MTDEADLDAVRAILADLRDARSAIARVRALHRAVQLEPDDEPWCDDCSNDREQWSLMAYPCATIRALDGES